MSYNSYDRLVAAMNQKARSGAYDNKHPLEELEKRAKRGDQNARSAFLMRTGRDINEAPAQQTTTDSVAQKITSLRLIKS